MSEPVAELTNNQHPTTDSRWIIAIVVLILLGTGRVAATHRVFSETLDEPAHIACGHEWLTGRPYTSDAAHPPLARALSAVPALLAGAPYFADLDWVARGNAVLYFQDRYEHNLQRARLGNLLFLILCFVATAVWARRRFDKATAVMATAILASMPPILGHAGVATTDMAGTATLILAIVALDFFIERPSLRRALALGTAVALGLLSKFSFVLFFPIAAIVVIAARWRSVRRPSLGPLAAALATLILLIWAGYRFDAGTFEKAHPAGNHLVHVIAPKPLAPAAEALARNVPLPAPLFFTGIALVKSHDRGGHSSYLFGEVSTRGWWYYFPVVFFFKTPLPFLILMSWGAFLIVRQRRDALDVLLIPLVLMLSVLNSSINIGVRHILPMYPPLAIVAGYASVMIWRRATDAFSRVALGGLVAWLFVGVGISHPDYLAWFNEAAGREPSRIAVDSNLDWGQDVLRLAHEVRKRKIERLHVLYTGNAVLGKHGIHAEWLQPWIETRGWIAISETALHLDGEAHRGAYRWLTGRYLPVTRVGRSIRLYYVP